MKPKNHVTSKYKLEFASIDLISFLIPVELIVAHTTPSMGFGYMSSSMKKPKVSLLNLEKTLKH